MLKTILYTISMIIISVLLFLLKITGMKMHIVLGILALVITIAYTLSIKKEFKEFSKKNIVMEILMRICLAIALITGFLLKPFGTFLIVSIIHKLAAIIFTVILLVINIKKIFVDKK